MEANQLMMPLRENEPFSTADILTCCSTCETNFVNIGSVPPSVPVDKLTSCQQMIQLQRERRVKYGRVDRCCMELM